MESREERKAWAVLRIQCGASFCTMRLALRALRFALVSAFRNFTSFIPQRLNGIDARRFAGREETGNQSDESQDRHCKDHCER